MRYFGLHYGGSRDGGPATSRADVLDVIRIVKHEGPIQVWEELAFTIKKGVPADYQVNDLGLRLCSPRMREVLDGEKAEGEQFQWLAARVEGMQFYVLHLPDTADVLNKQETVYHEGRVVRAVLRQDAVSSVFKCRPEDSLQLIVSERVRQKLVGCTGIKFEAMPQW